MTIAEQVALLKHMRRELMEGGYVPGDIAALDAAANALENQEVKRLYVQNIEVALNAANAELSAVDRRLHQVTTQRNEADGRANSCLMATAAERDKSDAIKALLLRILDSGHIPETETYEAEGTGEKLTRPSKLYRDIGLACGTKEWEVA